MRCSISAYFTTCLIGRISTAFICLMPARQRQRCRWRLPAQRQLCKVRTGSCINCETPLPVICSLRAIMLGNLNRSGTIPRFPVSLQFYRQEEAKAKEFHHLKRLFHALNNKRLVFQDFINNLSESGVSKITPKSTERKRKCTEKMPKKEHCDQPTEEKGELFLFFLLYPMMKLYLSSRRGATAYGWYACPRTASPFSLDMRSGALT
ncbi:hypothetical protein NPIL_170591 [Nephila pilipes]|uniref:Uncharacterized protein n=1 Tax=Nephila pilipes TaxID=299642 RepID=A0A8X6PDM4_NEPPI|nr:hypothetical protein NPIL_170591 [Nephila pilipes]